MSTPVLDAYIVKRIRERCISNEELLRAAIRPYIREGYRIKELTARYRKNYNSEHFYEFDGVRVLKQRSKAVLRLRRWWRFFVPYQIPEGK